MHSIAVRFDQLVAAFSELFGKTAGLDAKTQSG